MTTLEQLPDDVLVAVMRYLSVDDLLACRLVCKRLGVVLHLFVWRYRRLTKTKACVCAVLRLAPHLESAVFSSKVHSSAFFTTSCAVRELIMRIKSESPVGIGQGALVLRNQELLGRLRRVKLDWYRSVSPWAWVEQEVPDVDTLVKILAACSDLESLNLPSGVGRPSPGLVLRGPSRSSLKFFRCPLQLASSTFVKTVLAAHAPTLQAVDIDRPYGNNAQDTVLSEVGRLIAGMPKLKMLKCHVYRGFQEVAANKVLRHLSMSIAMFTHEMSNEWAAVLREANQIRTLSIVSIGRETSYIQDDLLQALASSGRSQVEVLSITNINCLPTLLRALPRLLALRQLELKCETRAENFSIVNLLLGITPKEAPALRRLTISVFTSERGPNCGHAWLHGNGVKTFLWRNPLVHVLVQAILPCSCELCTPHSVCATRQVGFFSHGPGDCPSPEDHSTADALKWVNVFDLPA